MINTRDEPHADPQVHRRLHVIVGDSNLSQSTLALRIGSTELMLRAIEDGKRFADLELADPGQAIRQTAGDLTGRTPLEFAAGGSSSPLAVLEACLDRCEGYTAGEPWLERAVVLWRRVLVAVADQRFDLVHHDIDWAIKHRLLRRDAERRGGIVDESRMAQLDLAHHDVRPGQGLFSRLEAGEEVTRIIEPDAVERAVADPPSTTRARLRGALITAAQVHERTHSVDWMTFTCRDLDGGNLICPDPLVFDDPRVDRLIERMATEPRVGRSSAFTIG